MMRKIERMDESIRQAIEGGFGRLKRKMTLANVYEKLKITSETTIMVCVLLANCEKIPRGLFMPFLYFCGIWQAEPQISAVA